MKFLRNCALKSFGGLDFDASIASFAKMTPFFRMHGLQSIQRYEYRLAIRVRRLIPMFNPRRDRWENHFHLTGAFIEPQDFTWEVTVRVLRLSMADRVARRAILQELGKYPRL